MADKQALQKLIEVYLAINPKPADEQFHDLARSIAMDPPALESVAYEMLSKDDAEADMALGTVVALTHLVASFTGDGSAWNSTAATEAEDVLDGDYDADTTTPDDLMLNDGEPAGTADDGNQSALYDDGVGPNDFGVDVDGDQSVLHDDGAPDLKIAAMARLLLTAAAPDQLAMTKAVHLKRSKYTLEQLAEEEGSCTVYALKLSVPAGDPKYYFAVSFGTGPSHMKVGDKSRFRTARVLVEGVFKISRDRKVTGRGEGKDTSRPVYMFK